MTLIKTRFPFHHHVDSKYCVIIFMAAHKRHRMRIAARKYSVKLQDHDEHNKSVHVILYSTKMAHFKLRQAAVRYIQLTFLSSLFLSKLK